MSPTTSQTSVMRGADGRLYAVTAAGVAEVAETDVRSTRNAVRAGDRAGFDTSDHEAGRFFVNPGC
ncbi:hypothetical protein [Azospirillum sp. A39]|uniref:hypothetical protein n=1 Tax=Azospirillum sp. A39 TaxID=3462279 RepID=UPI004045CA1D